MEPIHIPAHPKSLGFSAFEPVTKMERDLIAGYRCLSLDDRTRILLILQAMVSVEHASKADDSEAPGNRLLTW